jgi:hypothetical protein
MTEITIDSVTNSNKTGSFDVLVSELSNRLIAERSAARITGQEYASIYVQLMTAALQQSLSFELQKIQTAAQADLIAAQILQIQAERLRVEAATELLVQQKLTEVNQGLQILAQTNLVNMQIDALEEDILKTQAEVLKVQADTLVSEKQLLVMQSQIDAQTLQNTRVVEEIEFTKAKTFSEQAAYKDVVDGSAVAGVLGKQKLLLTAQTDGFARNSEQGLAKAMMDVFNIMRTTDPDATDPSLYGLSPASVTAVIDKAKLGVGIT